MIIAWDDEHEKQILKETCYLIWKEESNKLKYFLEDRNNLLEKDTFISQKKYVINLLKEATKIDCKTTRFPIE